MVHIDYNKFNVIKFLIAPLVIYIAIFKKTIICATSKKTSIMLYRPKIAFNFTKH